MQSAGDIYQIGLDIFKQLILEVATWECIPDQTPSEQALLALVRHRLAEGHAAWAADNIGEWMLCVGEVRGMIRALAVFRGPRS